MTFAYIFQHDILHLLHNQINCSFLLNLYSPAVCPKCRTVSHYLLQMRHTLLYKLVKTIWCMMSSSLRGNFNYLCCTFHSSALCLFLLMSSLGLSSIKDCLSRSWMHMEHGLHPPTIGLINRMYIEVDKMHGNVSRTFCMYYE